MHQGERHIVVLELESAEASHRPLTYLPATAELYATQNYRDAEPTIWLGKGESSTGFRLTLREAGDIATMLDALVTQAGR